MERPDVTVIGIAGPTRSGKSTLAKALAERLGIDPLLDIISADRFFKRQKPYNYELRCVDWEQPEAIDFPRLSAQIETAIRASRNNTVTRRPRYLIVEGFLLFAYAPIQRLFNKRIFVNISQRTCFFRRQASKRVSLEYFNKLLWPSFIKYNQHILNDRDILIVNGEYHAESLVEKALRFIQGESVPSEIDLLRQSLSQREMMTEADLSKARAEGKDSTQGYREGQERRNALKRRAESPERQLKVSRVTPPPAAAAAAAAAVPLVLPEVPDVVQTICERIRNHFRQVVSPVILLSTGSFAPIHKMHLQMMEVARNFVEQQDLYTKVVAGILSPSSDTYVNSKLRKRGERLLEDRKMTLSTRFLLIEDAIRLYDWLYVSDWEANQPRDVSFIDVVKHFEREFKDRLPRLRVMYVCGIDHVLKGVSLWSLRDSGVIAVARPGYSTDEAKKLLKQKYGSEAPFVHIVEDSSIQEASSTAIRQNLDSGLSLKDLVPESVEKRLQALNPVEWIKFTYRGEQFSVPISNRSCSVLGFQQAAKAPPETWLEITLPKGTIIRLPRQGDRIEHYRGVFTAIQGVASGHGDPILKMQRIALPQLDRATLELKEDISVASDNK